MTLRAVAFGDLGDTWGAALRPGSGLPSFAVLGTAPARVVQATLEGDSSPDAEWWIAGEGLELTVAPPISEGNGDRRPAERDFDQIVSVSGSLPGDRSHDAELLGARSERAQELEPGRFQLIREVAAWFAPGEGLAALAVRPQRATGHGDEELSVALFEAGRAVAVEEPRLSTTYTEDGLPTHAALELWLPPEEPKEGQDPDEVVSYPRRAAGEASGPGATHELGPLKVHVRPLRWRAGGRDGSGLYLIAWAT